MSSAEAFVPRPEDARLTAAMLSDSLDELGLRDQVLATRLAPVVAGSRVLGRAKTVQFAPSADYDPDDPYGDAIDFIDSVGAGDVIVVSTDDSNASGFWGELFSAAALGKGAQGIVTDGNVRDTRKIAAVGFPAFAPRFRPIDFRGRMRVVAQDRPVRLCGVAIAPGDLVLADDDGVVVVPAAWEAEVLAVARRRAMSESSVLAELLAGDSLRAVWNRHKVL